MLESAKTASFLIKPDVADKANRNDVNSVNLGFGIKYELKFFKIKKKRWSFWQVFAAMQWKKVHTDLFLQFLKCLSSNFLVESSKSWGLMFEKILEKPDS